MIIYCSRYKKELHESEIQSGQICTLNDINIGSIVFRFTFGKRHSIIMKICLLLMAMMAVFCVHEGIL